MFPCGFHLFVECLYYRRLASVYIFSSSWDTDDKDTSASVVYAVVVPMLKPFISILRIRDIKQALELFVRRDNFLK